MKYYIVIGSKGLPTCIYSEENDKVDMSYFKFCAEIDRVSAITFSRAFKKYIDECVKNRDPSAFDMTPYVVPFDIMKPDGNLDVAQLDHEVKNNSLVLRDNLLYK